MFNPIFIYFLFSSILIFSAVILFLLAKLKLPLWGAYLLSVNLTLFLFYLYDKLSAKVSFLRVPESILNLWTLLGATPAAFLAQRLFSHKTTKKSFQKSFKKIFVLQLVVLIAFGLFVVLMA